MVTLSAASRTDCKTVGTMGFQISIDADGARFTTEPGETVLDAALRQGIALPHGCRDGRCGSCAATLGAGEIDYPGGTPPALAGLGAGQCLTCRAVPRSDLHLDLPAHTRPDEPQQVRTLPCRVERIERLAPEVMGLSLKLPDHDPLRFRAGQYLDVLLRDGSRRAFSFASAPALSPYLELHIRRVPGGRFTTEVFERLGERALLRVQAPLGDFGLDPTSTAPAILIGGGTGFAPLKSMIEDAIARGLQRPLLLYRGARTRADLYLPDLAPRWAAEHPWFGHQAVLSEPEPDWDGRRGLVHQAVIEDFPDLAGHQVYISGPPAMIEHARPALLARGLDPAALFTDAFVDTSHGN